MRRVGIQRMYQCWSLENQANPRVAMTVNPPLMTLGQAKPALQIEVVSDRFPRALAYEQASEKARHHLDHLSVNRVLCPLEAIDQGFERRLPLRASPRSRLEGRGDFRDVLDVVSDRFLLVSNAVEAAVDAGGQASELRFCEPPFCSSTFRWIELRTSLNAAAIRTPGGCSGPP
jgi:hypothetical protein